MKSPFIPHVAIIMDGNGRWANQRRRPRLWGHVRGASKVSEIVEAATSLNIGALTLYAFSTENWKRPEHEVSVLFILLKKFLQRESTRLVANNIRFKIMGRIESLPLETQKTIQILEAKTAHHTGLKLNFAFDYGSRQELIHAFNQFHHDHPHQALTEDILEKYFYVNDLPPVDMLIRTSGEQRISNFLLWQCAYAEFFFTSTLWPDFSIHEFQSIIRSFFNRDRRFGHITSYPHEPILPKEGPHGFT